MPYAHSIQEAMELIYKGGIHHFADLPAELHTREVVKLWLMMNEDSLREIPAHLIDDDIRMYAVRESAINIRHIRSQDTAIYRDLFLRAIRGPGVEVGHVDVEAIGPRDMAAWLASRPGIEDDFLRVKRWKSQEDRDHYHNEMFAVFPRFIGYSDMPRIPDSIILEGAKNYGIVVRVLVLLEEYKRFELLQQLSELDNWSVMPKPSSLDEAAALFLEGVSSINLLLIKPFIRSFPIEEVCKVMANSVAQQEALTLLYTEDELRPLYEGLQYTKRRLLEAGLSL